MTTKTPNLPQKGAVARIIAERKKLRHQPLSPKLREVFRKDKDANPEIQEKKIASNPPENEPEMGI